jgi:hypothetical protein
MRYEELVPNMRKMRIIRNLPHKILEKIDHYGHMDVGGMIILKYLV